MRASSFSSARSALNLLIKSPPTPPPTPPTPTPPNPPIPQPQPIGLLHPLPQVVRRIDVTARGVFWSEGGSLVAIASDSSFYMLEYQRDLAESALASGQVRGSRRQLPACL